MPKLRKNSNGFSAFEAILIIIIIGLIVVIGYYVWHNNKKDTSNNTQNTASTISTSATKQKTSTKPKPNPYAGWKTYTSTLGGFNIKYPGTGWTLTAYHTNSGWVTGSSVTANENQFAINENPGQGSSNSNLKYSVSVNIENTPSAISQDNGALTYSLGSAQKTLGNGIQLWQTSENTFNTAGVPRCDGNGIVMIKAVSRDELYAKLPNGKYFNFTAGFCDGPNQKLTQSYHQQVNDPELSIAKKILESVNYE
jgi:hypothetical protein